MGELSFSFFLGEEKFLKFSNEHFFDSQFFWTFLNF